MSVMIGIDPHKGSRTAVVINLDEVVIDEVRVNATVNQVGQLQKWASGYPDRVGRSSRPGGWAISYHSCW